MVKFLYNFLDAASYVDDGEGYFLSFKIHRLSEVPFGRYATIVFRDREMLDINDPGERIVNAFSECPDAFTSEDVAASFNYFLEDHNHSCKSVAGCFYHFQAPNSVSESIRQNHDLLFLSDNLLSRAREDLVRAQFFDGCVNGRWDLADRVEQMVQYSHMLEIARDFPDDYKEILRLERRLATALEIEDYQDACVCRDRLEELR